jgi:hypothetical protein
VVDPVTRENLAEQINQSFAKQRQWFALHRNLILCLWITVICLLISALLIEKQAHRSKDEVIYFINLSCHRHASFSVFAN